MTSDTLRPTTTWPNGLEPYVWAAVIAFLTGYALGPYITPFLRIV